MRKQIVAGNWKMNTSIDKSIQLIENLKKNDEKRIDSQLMIAPPFTALSKAVDLLSSTNIEVVAQNMHFAPKGAFTGEISAPMLQSIGVNTVIIGHSERRAYFGETNQMLAQKVNTAIAQNMKVIFCFGEELNSRKNNEQNKVVQSQLMESLYHLPASAWNHIILAYEPVWAIGTGETASPEQAQEMHAFIRKSLSNNYGEVLANSISILYGGSVKPSNAKAIFSKPDVDGGLIGGASLDANDFIAISQSF